MVDMGQLPKSDLPDAYPYLPDLSGLQANSLAAVSVLPSTAASSALLGDLTGQLDLSALTADVNTFLSDATSLLAGLFGSSAAADLTSLVSTELLPSLTTLFASPLDFLGF